MAHLGVGSGRYCGREVGRVGFLVALVVIVGHTDVALLLLRSASEGAMRVEAVLAAIALFSSADAAQAQRPESFIVTAGQPLCSDQAALAAMLEALVSGNTEKAKRIAGCEFIVFGSRAVVIERFPSASKLGHVVKVRVTPPRKPPVTGYTIDVSPE